MAARRGGGPGGGPGDTTRAGTGHHRPGITDTRSVQMPVEVLHARLCQALRRGGHIRSAPVAAAFDAVRRADFLPGEDQTRALSQAPVWTRHPCGHGTLFEPAPGLVALMLEMLDAERGEQIAVLGAGSGFVPALVAQLVGRRGGVLAVDDDPDIASAAHQNRARAGGLPAEFRWANPALRQRPTTPPPDPDRPPGRACDRSRPDGQAEGNGRVGVGGGGRLFSRILVTGTVDRIPLTWWDSLTGPARLVVPLQLRPWGATRLVALEPRDDTTLNAVETARGGSLPALETPRPLLVTAPRTVDVGAGLVLQLDRARAAHADGAHRAFGDARARQRCWRRRLELTVTGQNPLHDQPPGPGGTSGTSGTGGTGGPGGLVDSDGSRSLDLWLGATRDLPCVARLLRVPGEPPDPLTVDLARRWGGVCLVEDGSVAWLTGRTRDRVTELGVAAVGAAAESLGHALAREVTAWHTTWRRHHPAVVVTRNSARDGTCPPQVQW